MLLAFVFSWFLTKAFAIQCYECTSTQGQECKYTAASCQYGFFGCVKIAAFSGGVNKMGMFTDQERSIVSMIRGCSLIPLGGADICEQTSILGTRVIKCTCFNDYCNGNVTKFTILNFALTSLMMLLLLC